MVVNIADYRSQHLVQCHNHCRVLT